MILVPFSSAEDALSKGYTNLKHFPLAMYTENPQFRFYGTPGIHVHDIGNDGATKT